MEEKVYGGGGSVSGGGRYFDSQKSWPQASWQLQRVMVWKKKETDESRRGGKRKEGGTGRIGLMTLSPRVQY